ncbi:hypothetical protein F7725_021342 [Dissostichus mawsoni]|uniref:Uncharacterized protein n=1 Tax=Dissostichus mawsoni TaxID=36200 RepID=A0A7J5YFU0_DISMA|nr:hypothetical protein F7725_021342 [Dissostichus mawsoni]
MSRTPQGPPVSCQGPPVTCQGPQGPPVTCQQPQGPPVTPSELSGTPSDLSGTPRTPSDLSGTPSELSGTPSELSGTPSDLSGTPRTPSDLSGTPSPAPSSCFRLFVGVVREEEKHGGSGSLQSGLRQQQLREQPLQQPLQQPYLRGEGAPSAGTAELDFRSASRMEDLNQGVVDMDLEDLSVCSRGTDYDMDFTLLVTLDMRHSALGHSWLSLRLFDEGTIAKWKDCCTLMEHNISGATNYFFSPTLVSDWFHRAVSLVLLEVQKKPQRGMPRVEKSWLMENHFWDGKITEEEVISGFYLVPACSSGGRKENEWRLSFARSEGVQLKKCISSSLMQSNSYIHMLPPGAAEEVHLL